MTPAEKIMLKKALVSLENSLRWNGMSSDWNGYANQMKNAIKSSTQLLDTILELPENNEKPLPPVSPTSSVESQRNLNNQLDDLLP